MTPHDPALLRTLFDAVVDLDAVERRRHLDAHCPPSLREDVEAMLDADAEEHDGPSSSRIGQLAAGLSDVPVLPPTAGTRIGPFEVVGLLGEGGYSTVLHAARDVAGARQEVALKLLRRSLHSPEAQRQFRREQQALLALRHPNIARLIEGGVTREGQPYIALELVRGTDIVEHAKSHALDLRARLRLFVVACRAVDAAHRALIVHRDLKPSNVFVADDGEVKLLDFGIAKLLVADEDVTRTMLPAFTPAYAAPEQRDGGAITTATDVYALGVLLGELLTGERVNDGTGRTPSSRISATAGESSPTPVTRRQLRGDLDTIVMKALADEPERRYASAGSFADDIERLLAGQPVVAHPPSRWYRTRKFVARHKGGVATTVAFLLAILASLGLALWQAHVAREQARLAHAHAARAETVRQFLVGVFEHASPDSSGGKPISARDLLAKGEQQAATALRGEPELEADVLALLGQLYIEIGDFKVARDLLQRALDMSAAPAFASDVRMRTLTGMARIDGETGAHDEAIAHAREALALINEDDSPAAADIANAHEMIANALISKGELTGVEAMLRTNLARDEAALGRRHEYVADQWLLLGVMLGEQGRFDESEEAFAHAIEGFREGFGENSNRLAHAFNEYSNMLVDKGDLAKAEGILQRSLAIRVATVGPDHHDALTVEANLIYIAEMQGRFAEALPRRKANLERGLRAGALHDRNIVSLWNAIGRDHRELGQFEEAFTALEKAIEISTRSQGPRNSWLINSYSILGPAQMLGGRLDDAERTAREGLSISLASQPEGSATTAVLRALLGTVLLRQHRLEEARTELELASAPFLVAPGSASTLAPTTLSALSEAQSIGGDDAEALATATIAVAAGRKVFAPGQPQLGATLFALGRAQLGSGDAGAAVTSLREALAVRSPPYPPEDPRVLEAKVLLAVALRRAGHTDEARDLTASIRAQVDASPSAYARELERGFEE